MSYFAGILHGAFQPREPQNDEYLNESDRLIYCAKCRTPRQCRIQYGEQILTPPVMCRCQREANENEKALFEHNQKQMRIKQLRVSGLSDKYLYDYTFANDKGYNPEEIKKAHRYADQWDMMEESCTGLLLWGDVGTGKTFIAGCIANALIEKGVPVLMTNFSRILNTLTGIFREDRNRFIESLNRYRLLIIDDLGIERNSDFALEQVFGIIDGRYRCKRPLIVTTNLTLDELKQADLNRAGIYDRIMEMCVPLRVSNRNIRKLNAAAKLEQTRKLLDDDTSP